MNERIKTIADAATLLFLRQGYSKTQISHIAKSVGVSVGTIYLDFAGKKEILHFVLKCTMEPGFINQEFERPITDELFMGIEQEIIGLFGKAADEFENYFEAADGHYNFNDLISYVFDHLAQYAPGCLFVEKNQYDFRALAEHYKTYRKRFLDAMTRCIKELISQGVIRELEYPELSTVLIIETISWWAMDRRYTAFETKDIPMNIAKAVCMDNLEAAYKK